MGRRPAVIITGGNGGIGESLVTTFSQNGYEVINLDLQDNCSRAIGFYVSVDLQKITLNTAYKAEIVSAICLLIAENDLALVAIVNNAAIQILGCLGELSVEDFRRSFEVNVLAGFVLVKEFSLVLRESKGSVVNIGSIHARLTKAGFCAYSTSKAALSAMTRALSLDLAPDVTLNCILPAATNTSMLVQGFETHPEKLSELAGYHPMGRIAEPREIAELALFLCSDKAQYITGAEFAIDGGIGSSLHDPK